MSESEKPEQAEPEPESEAAAPAGDPAGEPTAEEPTAEAESPASAEEAAESTAEEAEAKADAEPEPAVAELEAKVETPPADAEADAKADAKAAKAEGEVLITAHGLSKYYGPFKAIENVSFEVRRGQVVAFLGPNGAGKSTTMKCLTGIVAPDRGYAEISGYSVIDNRIEVAQRLGFLPENGPLYEDMTPRGLLEFLGEARGMEVQRLHSRITELSERLHLGSVMGKPIHKLSKGFRQRVGLAQALLHEPDVLIMDEPTSGLDPNQIRDVRRVIREFGQNKAVLLSTHILQEVEAIADTVVFIHQGEIVFKGTVEELKAQGDLEAAFASNTGYTATSWARS